MAKKYNFGLDFVPLIPKFSPKNVFRGFYV